MRAGQVKQGPDGLTGAAPGCYRKPIFRGGRADGVGLVTIAAVAVHPAGQPRREGWIRLLVPAPVVDLVQATREPVLLLEAPVPPGTYDAVRLEMDRGRGTLATGEEVPVTVPSRGAAAVSLRIRSGQATILTLDLVVHDLTDHQGKRYGVTIRRATVNP